MEQLQSPIGKYIEHPFSEQKLGEWLFDIQALPHQVEHAITNLDEAQLDTPYREGGWTVKQVVHHIADSHMNAYIRFKLGLTEENPSIKPYNQTEWANLSDTKNIPINVSITLLYALHQRWHDILKHIKAGEWGRTVFHPEHNKQMTLWYLLGMYSWHSRHHVAHITMLRERMKW